jgi:hypothetical protein
MADTVMMMTGGSTRVANLRDGLFGVSGANRASVFGKMANAGASGEDWAARYLAWMALGGTTKLLPQAVLGVVANTQVLGVKRKGQTAVADPNMLATAKHLCLFTLPRNDAGLVFKFDLATASFNYHELSQPLLATSGDLEMWRQLCGMGQPRPVRVLNFANRATTPFLQAQWVLRADWYPDTAPVGNHEGKIEVGVQPTNELPWCWIAAANDLAAAKTYAHEHAVNGQDLPECPSGWSAGQFTAEQQDAWATRAAINAGLAVFVYLDDLAQGRIPRFRAYNECPSP